MNKISPSAQDRGHPQGHDYAIGSPHLVHHNLNQRLVGVVREQLELLFATRETVRVLEIGAGHGAFTDHVLAAGAEVTITEMSTASAELLRRRYAHNPRASVHWDATGELTSLAGEQFDLILCVAVLHHIPDYLAAIAQWLPRVRPGGTFLSFQDPTWYPRRSRAALWADRGSFYVWRIGQGDLVEGVRSLIRRRSGRMDADNDRDMVEYHVLRQGCDERAIADLLKPSFHDVVVMPYWSTVAAPLQRAGERLGMTSNFGVLATGRS